MAAKDDNELKPERGVLATPFQSTEPGIDTTSTLGKVPFAGGNKGIIPATPESIARSLSRQRERAGLTKQPLFEEQRALSHRTTAFKGGLGSPMSAVTAAPLPDEWAPIASPNSVPGADRALTRGLNTNAPLDTLPAHSVGGIRPVVNPWPSPPATSLQTPAENYQTKVGATRFAGEEGVPGTNAPVVFRNADLQNGPWKPTETGRGLDTGGMDIEDIMARYAPPPAATPGTGLSIPSGGGYFGSLLSLATAIGNARAGRANEYQRWHRGIDMAKLAFDALNKSREAGIKAPYYATAGEHNLASADLARRQGLALEVKPEAQMRKDYIDTAQKVYSSLLSNGNMEPAQALEMAYQFADESMRRFSALGSPPSAKTTAKTAPMSYTKYRELANGHGITDEAKIEAGYKEDFGVEPYIPSARARQDIAGQESKSPYPEGTKLNGPGGKQYVVKNGVPIPTGEAMSSSPTVPVEQGRKLDSAKPEDQAIAAAILKEAGGDKNKAGEIARQRGYRF